MPAGYVGEGIGWTPSASRALRLLLAFAKEHSPYHAKRLADVEPAELTEAQLPHLPVMTKNDMMANFSEVMTDRRLTADMVERHLAALDRGADCYLLDQYRVITTSGSSGLRGIYVYGWDQWTTLGLMASRSRMAMLDGTSRPPGSATVNLLGSGLTTLSSAMSSFLADPDDPSIHLPMTTPIPDMIAILEAAQPVLLQAYPSALDLLVHEARANRLHIAPRFVESGGEMLSERTREDVRELWGAGIDDCWGLSEGIYAFQCPAGGSMHLPDDLVIVEPVDLEGHVVPPGEPAAKVYVTNLYNVAQPLIRYEIPDGLTVHEGICACGSAHRRIAALAGRSDQVFRYEDGVTVYPMVLGFAIEEERGLIEYQFRQTRPRGRRPCGDRAVRGHRASPRSCPRCAGPGGPRRSEGDGGRGRPHRSPSLGQAPPVRGSRQASRSGSSHQPEVACKRDEG